MKTTYTITRYDNGWAVDTKTGDTLKDYSAVFEDPDWLEDKRNAQAASLAYLVWNTFEGLLQTEQEGGLSLEFEETGTEEIEEQEETSEEEENEDGNRGQEG